MGRICSRCGRDLFDPDKHTVERVPVVDSRGTLLGRRNVRACNVRLIADDVAVDLATGERTVRRRVIPDSPQRTSRNNTRFVPADLFGPGKAYGA